jgi:hypothetical protein
MITAETITAERCVAIFHALAEATDKARRTMRQAQDSDITPAGAADSLNRIIERLQAELGRDSHE